LKKHINKIIIFLVVIALIGGLRYTPIADMLTLESIQENKGNLQSLINDNYVTSILIFILIYILVAGLSIPGATVLTLTSGFFYGALFGAILTNIGATIGALFAFWFARYLIGNWVHKKYGAKLKKFDKEWERDGAYYLLTLRFIPIFPFFLINLFGGLTKIPTRTFIWTTSLGIFPGSFVYAFAGKQLGSITSLGDIFSGNIIIAFVLLGVLALVPVLYKHYKLRKNAKKK